MVDYIDKMDETQKATLTVHVHLSMQSLLVDNLIWPYSELGTGASLRSDAKKALKSAYADPIIEVAKDDGKGPNRQHQSRFEVRRCRWSYLETRGGELPWISCNGGLRCSRIESAWMCGGTRIFLLVEDGLSDETVNHRSSHAVGGSSW